MLQHIKASTFIVLASSKFVTELPPDSRVTAIGTNSNDFLFLCVDPQGKEHRIKIPCWVPNSMEENKDASE